jgi:hypothetical protein
MIGGRIDLVEIDSEERPSAALAYTAGPSKKVYP